MKEFCKQHGITEAQFLGKEKISGSLYLGSLTSIPKGFNPTVGGSLDLRSLTSIPKGFNPTVGSSLYLRSGLKSDFTPLPAKRIFSWKKGKFIMVDNILCEVVNKRGKVYKIKIAGKFNESYLIIDGQYSSHGETLKKAKEDLLFKINSEKIKSEPIKKDTVITIQHYRIITGACEQGVKSWMQQNGITKDKIKASELLPLLKKSNAYGLDRFQKLLTF